MEGFGWIVASRTSRSRKYKALHYELNDFQSVVNNVVLSVQSGPYSRNLHKITLCATEQVSAQLEQILQERRLDGYSSFGLSIGVIWQLYWCFEEAYSVARLRREIAEHIEGIECCAAR